MAFSSLSDAEFLIAVRDGVNYSEVSSTELNMSYGEQNLVSLLKKSIGAILYDNNGDDESGETEFNIDCLYYSSDEFKGKKFKTHNYFSILHLNIHSLQRHVESLRTLLGILNFSFDIICLTETKIVEDYPPGVDISLPGYQQPVGMPTKATKGGVLIYVKNGIHFVPREDLNISRDKELESYFIELISNKTIVGSIYRHPSMDENIFINEYLDGLNQKIGKECKHSYLCGDFNFDLLKYANHNKTLSFIESMMSNFLIPTITLPTKINYGRSTLIDNIFTNEIVPDIISGNLTVSISDHLPSFVLIPKEINTKEFKREQYRRDYKNFNKTEFILDYFDIDWNDILELDKNDANLSTEKLISTMNDLIDKHIPLKKVPQKNLIRPDKPWISPHIISKIRAKDRLYKKYIKTKRFDLKERLKLKQNEITSLIRQNKKSYYEKYFRENKGNLKKIWQGIKQIISINPKVLNSPTCIINEDRILTDEENIANSFNSYFSSIAGNILKKRINHGNKSFSDYLSEPLQNSITFYDCDAKEVNSLITMLSTNKTSGLNSIPTVVLKLLKENLSIHLAKVFNISMSTGVHPKILRTSNTIPIYKNKGSRLDVNNYRPISLLSNINKLLEKIIYNRIIQFLEKYNRLYKLQFGFRTQHSTNHTIVDITEKIKNALDNNKLASGIFIDLQKAFDTVNHNILINKLEHNGIRGVPNNWFSSYLSERQQYVTINGKVSTSKLMEHGVPQGSVLGPLLFLVYINDLHKAIKHSTAYHFADDTNLININSSPKKMQKQINMDLKLLYQWLLANKISLNCSKTEFIIFKKPRQIINFHFKIRMNGTRIYPVKSIKYLGVHLDEYLNGTNHGKEVLKKLIRANGMLAKVRHYVQQKELLSIYHAIFSAHVSYGSQFWGQNTNSITKKIFLQQKKALRIMTFSPFQTPSSPLFKLFKVLKFEDMIRIHNCLFVHDYFTGKLPESFANFFIKAFTHSITLVTLLIIRIPE